MRTVRYAEAVGSRKYRYDFWKTDRQPYGLVNTLEHRFATFVASSTSGKVKSSILTACPLFCYDIFVNSRICFKQYFVKYRRCTEPLYFVTVIEFVTRGDISYCKIFARKRENCFTITASIDVTSIKHDYTTHLNVTHGRALSSSFFFFFFFFLFK